MDLETIACLLGLPDTEVVEAKLSPDGKSLKISVIPTCTVALCPDCAQASGARNRTDWQSFRDLPIAGKDVTLSMPAIQFGCNPCGKFFTIPPPGVLEGSHVTVRLAEALADCVNASTLRVASVTYHLPESTVKTIFEKVIHRRLEQKNKTLKPITKLGIDEVHLEVRDDTQDSTAPASSSPPESPGDQEKKIERR